MNNSSVFTNVTFREEEHDDDDEQNYGCPLLEKESTLENVSKITAIAVIIALSLTGNVLVIVI